MSTQAIQTEIPPAPASTPELAVVTLDTHPYEGHWVQYYRATTIDQFIAFVRAGDDVVGALLAMKQRIVQTSFPGSSIGDQDLALAFVIIRAWQRGEEDATVDPQNGSD